MSPLPEKKKSSEEIQRLREALAGPRKPIPSAELTPPPAEIQEPATPASSVTPSGPRPVHSLKKSERTPLRVIENEPTRTPTSNVVPQPMAAKTRSPLAVVQPSSQAVSSGASKIPSQRHGERELAEMRRRAAIELLHPKINPRLLPASRWLLAFGYLGPVIAAGCIWLAEQPIEIGPAACGMAFVSGTTIAIRRPVSRHHAAFMMTIAFAILVCAAFHYFPQHLHAK